MEITAPGTWVPKLHRGGLFSLACEDRPTPGANVPLEAVRVRLGLGDEQATVLASWSLFATVVVMPFLIVLCYPPFFAILQCCVLHFPYGISRGFYWSSIQDFPIYYPTLFRFYDELRCQGEI